MIWTYSQEVEIAFVNLPIFPFTKLPTTDWFLLMTTTANLFSLFSGSKRISNQFLLGSRHFYTLENSSQTIPFQIPFQV